jgi:hypothetical protein
LRETPPAEVGDRPDTAAGLSVRGDTKGAGKGMGDEEKGVAFEGGKKGLG